MRPIDAGPAEWEAVRRILRDHAPGIEVRAFGSRVSWTARETSDLDLVLMTEEPLEAMRLAALRAAFTDSGLPFRVDVVDWASASEAFRRVIEREYVMLAEGDKPCAAGWTKVTLGDLIDLRLSSVDKKTKPTERPVRLCNYLDVYKNQFIHSGLDFMNGTATAREIANCTLRPGDVVITKDSEKHDDIGVPALVREDIPGLVCGYHLAILRSASPNIDGAYLFYALNTHEVQKQFHSYANGVTRFGLRKSDIGLIEIPLPPLSEQRAIADVLGVLDERIEVHRRMNQTLEAMAQALFKDWFIDFGPTRAKTAGHKPYLPKPLWNLFPNNLTNSELGEIPEGWRVSTIGEEIDVVGGSTPSTKEPSFWGGSVHWATPKDLSALKSPVLLGTDRKITEKGLARIGSGLLPEGTVLLSSRAPIGYLAITDIPVAVNQGFIAMKCHKQLSAAYVWLWNAMNLDAILEKANGSTFLEINKRNFRSLLIIVPPEPLIRSFNDKVEPLIEKIINTEREIRTLANLRDTLLPKLISGKIRLHNTERQTGNAA